MFLELSKKLEEEWTVTLSHEALELIGDPEANLLAQGWPDAYSFGRVHSPRP